jgi:hypothetical protein
MKANAVLSIGNRLLLEHWADLGHILSDPMLCQRTGLGTINEPTNIRLVDFTRFGPGFRTSRCGFRILARAGSTSLLLA